MLKLNNVTKSYANLLLKVTLKLTYCYPKYTTFVVVCGVILNLFTG